jgi:hypothetical protein
MAERELRININGDSKGLDQALSDAQRKLVAFSGKMKDIGRTLSFSITAPLAVAGTAAVKFASDLNESLNKVEVAFKSSANEIKSFAKTTMTSFGIAEGTALDMASNFGDMATSMGLNTKQAAEMSKSLVGLAGDLASFKNVKLEVAQTALTGIFTGETESMKRLGYAMQEENVKLWAMANGIKKSYEEMTQAEKVILRYKYILSSAANAQGDFIRTQGGAANQMRMFQEGLKQLGTQFGQIVLPTVTKVVTALNGFVKYLSEADSGTKTLILALAGFAAVTGPMLYIAGSVIPKMVAGFNLLTAAATRFNLTVGSGSAIAVLATMLGYAAKSAYDYSTAQIKLVKNNKDVVATENDSVESIYAKNKAIYDQISAIDKQISQSKGIKPGQFGQAVVVDEKSLLKSKNALINTLQANRSMLDQLKNQNQNGVADGALDSVIGGMGTAKATKDTTLEIKKELLSLADDVQNHRDKTLEFHKELLALRGLAPQENLKMPDFAGTKIDTGAILTPFQLMDQQIAQSTKTQLENLALLSIEYDKIMTQGQAMADGVSQAFGVLGDSIMQSFGQATNGLQGFLQGMARTVLQLGQIVLKEIIMNQARATANAVAGATASGAATGPAAVFTTPAFIATAVGGVLSAFAAIPKFAAGGIVSGPTMGLMGEYPGAKSNPEVIAPLNKLQGMMDTGSGGNMNLTGEFVVRGQDLVLALQRAERQKNRIG